MEKKQTTAHPYDDWMKKIHEVSQSNLAKSDDELNPTGVVKNDSDVKRPHWLTLIAVFLLALLPRLYFLFFLTDPQNVGIDWYGDVYHHWQIAYLSKEVGFGEGFLRLWDFKGLEYYWGLLHPLVLAMLFAITGSISIVIPRLVSVVFGSASILLIFLIIRKYYNTWTAWGAAIFVTFLPVTLFSDTVGMQEPLGLFFLLLGIYIVERHPVFAGFSWMLAGMERSEFWLFGAALTVIALFRLQVDKKVQVLLGYIIPCLVYMKYLMNWTGNPIYPIWTAYMGTYVGEWNIPRPLTPHQAELQIFFRIAFFILMAISIYIFWKKPRGYFYLLLGFGNVTFFVLMHAFGSRMGGWIDDTWNGVDRLLAFPYAFLGTVLAILLLYYLPKLSKHLVYVGMTLLIGVLIAIQPTWLAINKWHAQAMHPSWDRATTYGQAIADNWDKEHTIIMSSGEPALTYTVSYFHNIPAKKLQGDMYSPFYYAKSDPFSDWPKFRGKIIKWFRDIDAGQIVYMGNFAEHDRLGKMLKLEEGRLVTLKATNNYYRIYTINLPAE